MEITGIHKSIDGVCTKYTQRTSGNEQIETTYVDYRNKYIICLSSQVGCNMRCQFCYNGLHCTKKYVRSLTAVEIVQQAENVIAKEKGNMADKPILFNFMGIGEPMLNIANVAEAMKYLKDMYPTCRFALATSVPDIDHRPRLIKLTKPFGKDFKLTISLHSAIPETRSLLLGRSFTKDDFKNLVWFAKSYSIEDNMHREVEWNYVLFDGINDDERHALELHKLLHETYETYSEDKYKPYNNHIRINKFNPVEGCSLIPSSPERAKKFIDMLKELHFQVEQYETNGSDIGAACGQLIAKYDA